MPAAPVFHPPRPWSPLSGAEFAALSPVLSGPPRRRGRRPADLRRTLDAVFWIAASTRPWKELPPELGEPDTASRALRRWTRAGLLEVLLARAAQADAGTALAGLAWWLARAFRRMARIVSLRGLLLVKYVLRLADAWPANPLTLPDRNLSKTAKRQLDLLNGGLLGYARRFSRAARQENPPPPQMIEAGARAAAAAIRAVRAQWQMLRLATLGNRHQWKLK
jgi:transposase